MITLTSSDGETFEVEEAVAMQCKTIKNIVEDICPDDSIPLPNVTSIILAKVIEYCRKHVEAADEEALDKVDSDFADEIKTDQNVLFDLVLV